MRDRAPASDADDVMLCRDCQLRFVGKSARRKFREHEKKGCGSINLTYGWAVRRFGLERSLEPA